MTVNEVQFMDRGDGLRLAYDKIRGAGGRDSPTLVWLSGFKSDMGGTKAQALAEWARAEGRAYLRLDYSGHGQSEGAFEDGCISRWRDDALAVIDAQSSGPLVLIGSSMGGWIALLVALARPERVKGLLLIAPAPDFTEKLMWPSLSAEARRQIMDAGRWDLPSAYDEAPTPITRRMIEDGARHTLLDAPIAFAGPVRILQGGLDPDVPPAHAQTLFDRLESADKSFTLVPDGDHRLSRPEDIALLLKTAGDLAERVEAKP